jgi:hypothetical protein
MRHDTVTKPPGELLYLEDLHVGRRFTSGTHALDEQQIVAFASEFAAILSHGSRGREGHRVPWVSRRANGTPQRSRCVFRWMGASQ